MEGRERVRERVMLGLAMGKNEVPEFDPTYRFRFRKKNY